MKARLSDRLLFEDLPHRRGAATGAPLVGRRARHARVPHRAAGDGRRPHPGHRPRPGGPPDAARRRPADVLPGALPLHADWPEAAGGRRRARSRRRRTRRQADPERSAGADRPGRGSPVRHMSAARFTGQWRLSPAAAGAAPLESPRCFFSRSRRSLMPRGILFLRRGARRRRRRLREQRGQRTAAVSRLRHWERCSEARTTRRRRPTSRPASRSSARSFHTSGQRRRRREVEAQLDLAVAGVHVLAARPRGARETPHRARPPAGRPSRG